MLITVIRSVTEQDITFQNNYYPHSNTTLLQIRKQLSKLDISCIPKAKLNAPTLLYNTC